ncbi:MAG: transposase [Bacteroidota bacterium]
MKYNPNIHHRRSIRLKGYDYSQAGLYFITICVQDRKHLFGKIENKKMILNDFGIIAYQQWQKLSEHFPNFELDVFQIMPNHIHGIVALTESVGATLAVTPNDNPVTPNDNPVADETRATARVAPTKSKTVGNIVGTYKSLVANGCLEQFKLKNPNEIMGKLWQRNYHEHIIRDEQSYQHISDYIINNPKNWMDDKFYE